MSKIELNHCPFCGGSAEFEKEILSEPVIVKRQPYGADKRSNFIKQNFHIKCQDCKFSTRDFAVFIEIAEVDGLKLVDAFWENPAVIRAAYEWNRRADTEIKKIDEQLAELRNPYSWPPKELEEMPEHDKLILYLCCRTIYLDYMERQEKLKEQDT